VAAAESFGVDLMRSPKLNISIYLYDKNGLARMEGRAASILPHLLPWRNSLKSEDFV